MSDSDDYTFAKEHINLDTHCVVCEEPRSTHPTESNNPRPLFNEGRACRDCNAYIIAARLYSVRIPHASEEVIGIIRNFLNLSMSVRAANKRAVEMMQAEADRLSAEQTAREEAGCPDCGYIEDDVATHYENCVHFDTDLIADDDTEEDWS